eukprot:CAMPEP_0194398808 /NCGR_PEP_ID=MMETSP0174-20130528/126313_1 /TAXON_ID=216777 /ORGANISM="Proboscia alata, Strain PI-D3" /LENGTH=664 /DNA_ID=CAMNT_0039195153 /DNA_START=28 /DNA_END=2022 /DNA_ORIENTATION=-
MMIERYSAVMAIMSLAISPSHAFTPTPSTTQATALTATKIKSPTPPLEPYNADAALSIAKRRTLAPKPTSTTGDDPEWKFFDTAKINVAGGMGGNGCVAFRREKGAPHGGPSGGRGGRGGSVWLECDAGMNTLAPLRQVVHSRAKCGKNGVGKDKNGVHAGDVCVKVPPGTLVRELLTQKLAGELRTNGERLLVAKGGRGGRGNAAFMTARNTAPKIAEHGEPGAQRWLTLELRLVADVGFLGLPNAGKSTLLSAASAARPKIADYPFTTIIPNLGVCDLDAEAGSGLVLCDVPGLIEGAAEGAGLGPAFLRHVQRCKVLLHLIDGTSETPVQDFEVLQKEFGLVLCDVPGLIEGAAEGAGLGPAFLRHVQRCKVLLHLIDGTSETPIQDFEVLQKELMKHDPVLAAKPQVVVINKMDIPEVREKKEELVKALRVACGHSRVLTISAATTENVKELMGRLKKFVMSVRDPENDLPPPNEIDFSDAGLDSDSDDFEIMSDPAYPNQWRVNGAYIEQVAKMTHWEYPEAIARFGRQLEALGIAAELTALGAEDGDLVMVDKYDFNFAPHLTNVYIPSDLLEADTLFAGEDRDIDPTDDKYSANDVLPRAIFYEATGEQEEDLHPGLAAMLREDDVEELIGFNEDEDWDMLDEDELFDDENEEVWIS